uniref:Uncharacterized protein n=1 Tax=Setaria viridis TaxID=4556 RepID=A0A4U6V1R2_SETVI|nr:hypothetical protein SEVIR_4G264001v2 [Setaria viridis]
MAWWKASGGAVARHDDQKGTRTATGRAAPRNTGAPISRSIRGVRRLTPMTRTDDDAMGARGTGRRLTGRWLSLLCLSRPPLSRPPQ